MKKFLIALQFLTIIPAETKSAMDKDKMPSGIIYFPIIGLLLGLILAATNQLLSLVSLNHFPAASILVTLLIILTGGLHLDGLADTSDALFSRKTRPEMLKIMRDSHIGTMGVLSLIIIILLKVSILASLDSKVVNVSLIMMCLLSRYFLVWSMFFFPYIRQEGKAKAFVAGINLKIFSWATAITLFCVLLFLGLKGLIIFIAVTLFTSITGKFITQKIGGMTGDTLGAINELVEVFMLFNVLMLTRLWA